MSFVAGWALRVKHVTSDTADVDISSPLDLFGALAVRTLLFGELMVLSQLSQLPLRVCLCVCVCVCVECVCVC